MHDYYKDKEITERAELVIGETVVALAQDYFRYIIRENGCECAVCQAKIRKAIMNGLGTAMMSHLSLYLCCPFTATRLAETGESLTAETIRQIQNKCEAYASDISLEVQDTLGRELAKHLDSFDRMCDVVACSKDDSHE